MAGARGAPGILLALVAGAACVGARQHGSNIASARATLIEMLRVDQAIQFDPVLNPADALHNTRIDQQFARNVPAFEAILNEFGWPRKSTFGPEASKAAFLVAQHADAFPAFQARCLELLRAAVAQDEASPRDWALLTDRVLKNAGKPQRFGTQWDGGQLWPIAEPDQVERRRAEVGLNTLAEQKAEYDALIEQLRATFNLQPQ